MCNKIFFATQSEAAHQAHQFSRRSNQSMKEYKCPDCDAWHLKTRGKRKLQQLKKPKYRVLIPGKIEKP